MFREFVDGIFLFKNIKNNRKKTIFKVKSLHLHSLFLMCSSFLFTYFIIYFLRFSNSKFSTMLRLEFKICPPQSHQNYLF